MDHHLCSGKTFVSIGAAPANLLQVLTLVFTALLLVSVEKFDMGFSGLSLTAQKTVESTQVRFAHCQNLNATDAL